MKYATLISANQWSSYTDDHDVSEELFHLVLSWFPSASLLTAYLRDTNMH